ncbi:PAS domain S-box protein [Marinoscillum sp.]|uniref:hybrid sensor histidine kinase/response regulator n=1 Tax=Marinoscillum sp. TaxID=2024838 RepID=UPI003BADB3E5
MKILYLEDNISDFELLKLSLDKSSLDFTLDRAENKAQFQKALELPYDIIISDYNLQGFTGTDALKMLREKDQSIPFVVISGTVGEEQAVSLLHYGASDFLLKKNVRKLPIIIERAFRNKMIDDERRNFQKELINKNLILDSLFHSFEDMVFLKDNNGAYLKVNKAFSRFFGFTEKAIIGMKDRDLFDHDIARKADETDEYVHKNKRSATYEISFMGIDGVGRILEVVKYPVMDGDVVTGVVGSSRDITERKMLEEKNAKNQYILNQAEQLTYSGSFQYDAEVDILNCSPHFVKMMGISGNINRISLMKFLGLIYKDDHKIFNDEIDKVLDKKVTVTIDHRYIPNGSKQIRYGRTTISPDYSGGDDNIFYGTIVDTTSDYENDMALLNIQEQERSNISKELHDNLGQKMSASALFLDGLITKYPKDTELTKVANMINSSLTEIRSLSSTLSLSGIKQMGLENSLRQLQDQIPLSIEFDLHYSLDESTISEFVSTQTFRIVQEAINNIQKHSEAKKIEIDLAQAQSVITLKIRDNGKGFDMNKGVRGNGLRNMEQRVKKCNGLIHIDSKINEGTFIDIKLPIK